MVGKLEVVNTWDGRLTKEWDQITLDDAELEKAIKKWVFNYYLGISVLEGGGNLLEYWDDIEEFLIFEGHIVLVEENGRIVFCKIFSEDNSLAGKEDLIVVNIDDATKPQIKLITEGKPNPNYKFVIFENDRGRHPILPGEIGYFIKKIVNIVRKMDIDLFTSERRVMITVPQQAAEEDIDYLVSTFSNIFFTLIAMPHSRKPDASAVKAGNTGIRPSQIGEPIYIEPKGDMSVRYIREYKFWMSQLLQFMGIRHDPLLDKEERASTTEVSNSTAPFEAWERKGWKARNRGINEWKTVFKEAQSNYKLTYGRYKGLNKD